MMEKSKKGKGKKGNLHSQRRVQCTVSLQEYSDSTVTFLCGGEPLTPVMLQTGYREQIG